MGFIDEHTTKANGGATTPQEVIERAQKLAKTLSTAVDYVAGKLRSDDLNTTQTPSGNSGARKP